MPQALIILTFKQRLFLVLPDRSEDRTGHDGQDQNRQLSIVNRQLLQESAFFEKWLYFRIASAKIPVERHGII
jgi:hypothetical protein